MIEKLAAASADPKTVMIYATSLKAHRTASSLRVNIWLGRLIGRTKRRDEHQAARRQRSQRPPAQLLYDRRLGKRLADAAALRVEMPKAQWLLGERGYNADWFRDALQARGIQPYTPVGGPV